MRRSCQGVLIQLVSLYHNTIQLEYKLHLLVCNANMTDTDKKKYYTDRQINHYMNLHFGHHKNLSFSKTSLMDSNDTLIMT